MWNVVKVYFPEVVTTYLEAPQFRDQPAGNVVVDLLSTLTRDLPGLDDGYRSGGG